MQRASRNARRVTAALFFAALVALVPARGEARFFTRPCGTLLAWDDSAHLRVWAEKYRVDGGLYCSNFTPDQYGVILGDLPAGIRQRMFAGTSEEVKTRLERLGLPPCFIAPLDFVLQRNGSVEEVIARAAALPPERQAELRAEFQLRRDVLEAKERLGARNTPEYRIRFEGDTLIVPDGKRYRYKKLWRGKLLIQVRWGDILRTQTYESGEVVRKYLGDHFLGFWGFVGLLGPDGRFEISDQHHRTKAYLLRHTPYGADPNDTLLPMIVERAGDGHYYTTPHWAVLSSGNAVAIPFATRTKWYGDRTWSFLPAETRKRVIEESKTSAIGALRELYYSETGLSRLLP